VIAVRALRWLAGALVWLLAALLGVVGVVLSITIILLPLGLPVLWLTRRLFGVASRLMLPRALTHPVDEAGKAVKKQGRKSKKKLQKKDPGAAARRWRKRVAKRGRRGRKRLRS
jgi:hypothetical protein